MVAQAGGIVMWRGTQRSREIEMRDWISAPDAEQNTYLIQHLTHDGDYLGWQYADASGVIDVLQGRAWVADSGEYPDKVKVLILTDLGALPVVIKLEGAPEFGLVYVDLSFRKPGKRGQASLIRADRGAYKSPQA
jgi:hypothetical protein